MPAGLMKTLKSKKKKLALTSFYYPCQGTRLGDSLKFIGIDQSRFYNFLKVGEFKNTPLSG